MKTTLHYYHLSAASDEYRDLSCNLKHKRLRLFRSFSADGYNFYEKVIKPLDRTLVELDTSYLFDNQWNTVGDEDGKGGIRVFDWSETIVPNEDIRIGMWLEQTNKMHAIRGNTQKCGFCGAMHQDSWLKFCTECVGSAYLDHDQLPLLRLLPVSNRDPNRMERAKTERVTLAKEYEALEARYLREQVLSKAARDEDSLKKRRLDIANKAANLIHRAEVERDGHNWLLDHGINDENCLYYPAKNTFGFGWRMPMSKVVANSLRDVLKDFPYAYEINEK
jgi:hypothetical protein